LTMVFDDGLENCYPKLDWTEINFFLSIVLLPDCVRLKNVPFSQLYRFLYFAEICKNVELSNCVLEESL
jgi:hypothetical protein